MNSLEMLIELVFMISFAHIPKVGCLRCNRRQNLTSKAYKVVWLSLFFVSTMSKYLQQPSTGLGCLVH